MVLGENPELLVCAVDVFADDEAEDAEETEGLETAAIESKNIFMFMFPGKPDRKFGLSPAKPEANEVAGNPKPALDVGTDPELFELWT